MSVSWNVREGLLLVKLNVPAMSWPGVHWTLIVCGVLEYPCTQLLSFTPGWSTLIGPGPSKLCSDWLGSWCCYASSLMSPLSLCLYGIRVAFMHGKNLNIIGDTDMPYRHRERQEMPPSVPLFGCFSGMREDLISDFEWSTLVSTTLSCLITQYRWNQLKHKLSTIIRREKKAFQHLKPEPFYFYNLHCWCQTIQGFISDWK